jgi:hypothetical protein
MCNVKTMLKTGLGMLLLAAIAYIALPDFRTWILAAAPFLLYLICPISMLFCMKMMSGQNGQSCQSPATKGEEQPAAVPNNTEVKIS